MKYFKKINGEIEFAGQVIRFAGKQIINPTHDQLINSGYNIYTEFDPSPERLLQSAIMEKISEIEQYDVSEAVNSFSIQNTNVWLSREERIVLKDRFTREIAKNKQATILRYQGISFEISPQFGLDIINAVSDYADKCYDNTETKKEEADKCLTLEQVENIDVTYGYPSKLSF